MKLSFDPFKEFAGSTKGSALTGTLSSLHATGRWIWDLGEWKTAPDLELILNFKNSFIDFCVRNQSGAWFTGGGAVTIERSSVRGMEWLDDGLRRGLHNPFWDEYFDGIIPKEDSEQNSDLKFGFMLMQAKRLHSSRMYWAHSLESISNAYKAWVEKNEHQLVMYSIEAGEALRQGFRDGNTLSLKELKRSIELQDHERVSKRQAENLASGRAKGAQVQKEHAAKTLEFVERVNNDLLQKSGTAYRHLNQRADYITKKLLETGRMQPNGNPYKTTTIYKMITGK